MSTRTDPIVAKLLLETVLVFQQMLAQSTPLVTTWSVSKSKIQGDYEEIIKRVEEGAVTLEEVKEYVELEHRKCAKKFKRKKSSSLNNLSYYFASLLSQMLAEIQDKLVADSLAEP